MADEPGVDFTASIRILKAEAEAHQFKGKSLVHMTKVLEDAMAAQAYMASLKDKKKFQEDEIKAIAEKVRQEQERFDKQQARNAQAEKEAMDEANTRIHEAREKANAEEAKLAAKQKEVGEKIPVLENKIANAEQALAALNAKIVSIREGAASIQV